MIHNFYLLPFGNWHLLNFSAAKSHLDHLDALMLFTIEPQVLLLYLLYNLINMLQLLDSCAGLDGEGCAYLQLFALTLLLILQWYTWLVCDATLMYHQEFVLQH